MSVRMNQSPSSGPLKKLASVSDICEAMIALETKHGLLYREIGGVKIWQAIRMPLYYEIAKKTGVLDMPHFKKKTVFDRLRNLGSFLRSTTIYNPFTRPGRKKTVIFDHTRKVLVDGRYIDIYTDYMIREMKKRGENFEVIEGPHDDRHLSAREKSRTHSDFILIVSNIVAALFPARFTAGEKSFITMVENEIKATMGFDPGLAKTFSREIVKFRVRYILVRALLGMKKPEKVILLVAYGHPYVVKAAKDLGIRCIELQHGVFSDYHLGYSYPHVKKESLEYFPNEFHVWEEFWKKMCVIPLDDANIKIHPFDHLVNQGKKYLKYGKKPRQVLVLSQGVIGSRLADIMLDNIGPLRGFTIMYKLHPGEYSRWREYESMLSLSGHDNVTIIDNNDMELYRLMAESKYLVGVFSTAVFESLYFNCDVILADLPGIEYMTRLVKSGRARLLKKGSSIASMVARINEGEK